MVQISWSLFWNEEKLYKLGSPIPISLALQTIFILFVIHFLTNPLVELHARDWKCWLLDIAIRSVLLARCDVKQSTLLV